MSERTSPGRQPYVADPGADSELHRTIDRVYDKAETFVAGLGRALGVSTEPVPVPVTVPVPALSTSPARALPAPRELAEHPFEIVEVMADGRPIAWLVTNGHESARCESKAIAEAVLEHLQKATRP